MDSGIFGFSDKKPTVMHGSGAGGRTLVIALSGCSWNVLEPLLESGDLPNLRALKEAGSHGVLESVIPFQTGPAWASFATGAGPASHGVYDLVTPVGGDLRPVTAEDLRCPPYWKRIGQEGKRSVIVNFPLHQDGCEGAVIINGWLSGDESRRVVPVGRRERYERLLEPYRRLPRRMDDIDELCRIAEARFDLMREAFLRESWDHFLGVFATTDWLSHSAVGRFLAGEPEARASFVRLYRQLDRYVGWLVEHAPDATVAVLSEHGQCPEVAIVRVNTLLHRLGLVRLTNGGLGSQPGGSTRMRLSIRVPRTVSAWRGNSFTRPLTVKTRRVLRRRLGIDLAARLHAIDRVHSKAFSPTDTSFGIYVQNGGNTELDRIREELLALEIADGGGAIDIVQTPEQLYRRPVPPTSPRLIFAPAAGVRSSVAVRERSIGKPPKPGLGCHQRDGILLLAGPSVKAGSLGRVSLCDIAPTLLWTMGLAVPSTVEGRVLTEAYDRQFVADHPVHRVELAEQDQSIESDVMRRLKALGYI